MNTSYPNQATTDFIRCNADGDVRQLALKGTADKSVDLHYALEQIAGRQTARRKLPSWASVEGLEYPPHLSLEQCSGEKAAQYKAEVVRRLLRGVGQSTNASVPGRTRLVDLTGGFGVDFSFMAHEFDEAVYVERQERLCNIARRNLPLLGLPQAEVVCTDGTNYLVYSNATMIFLDPARRDNAGGRTYAISDCTPDVISLRDVLLARADYVMVKLSPMLDWRKAVADLGDSVGEVHIVSTGNECKDLLLVMSHRYGGLERLYCVNDSEATVFDFRTTDSTNNLVSVANSTNIFVSPVDGANSLVPPGHFLFEPNASVMKAGMFDAVERLYGVRQVGRNSHLFVSEIDCPDFPGRSFRISAVVSMNKKELKVALAGIRKANITVRNFPLSVAELRKRLKIADGGDMYIFATTLSDGSHVLLVCNRLGAGLPPASAHNAATLPLH